MYSTRWFFGFCLMALTAMALCFTGTFTSFAKDKPAEEAVEAESCTGGPFEHDGWKSAKAKDGSIFYTGSLVSKEGNMDAYLAKTNRDKNVCWQRQLTNGSANEVCFDIGVNKIGDVFILCTVDSPNTSFRAGKNAFQPHFGQSPDPVKVSYIGKFTLSGKQSAGTFFSAKMPTGHDLVTLPIKQLRLHGKGVRLYGQAVYGAPLTQTPIKKWDDKKVCRDNSTIFTGVLSGDLSTLVNSLCQ